MTANAVNIPVLSARDVSVMRGVRQLLSGVSFDLNSRELVALVGPNGAGKTTLMRAFAGLQSLTSGRIMLADRNLAELDGAVRARALSYMPQTREVHWPLPVREVVLLGQPGAMLAGGEPNDGDEFRALADKLDIGALLDRKATEVSGGELARVLLARAMLQPSRILIADEPTAGLDLAHRLAAMQALREVARRDGRAVLVSLHDLATAARFADRIVVMHGGRIAADGTAAQALAPEVMREVWQVDAELREVDGVPVLLTRQQLSES